MFSNDPVRKDPSKVVLNLIDGDGEVGLKVLQYPVLDLGSRQVDYLN